LTNVFSVAQRFDALGEISFRFESLGSVPPRLPNGPDAGVRVRNFEIGSMATSHRNVHTLASGRNSDLT
jgi:hypothetical protein